MEINFTESIRGRKITNNIRSYGASLENTLKKLNESNWDKERLSDYYKKTYDSYCLERIIDELKDKKRDQCIDIIKKNILDLYENEIGPNCIDIYIVAYGVYKYGAGIQGVYEILKAKMGYIEIDVAKKIWKTGLADGTYLKILDKDGMLLDKNFICKWIYIEDDYDYVFDDMIKQYDDEDLNENRYLIYHSIKKEDIEFSEDNIKKEKRVKKTNKKNNTKKKKKEYREIYSISKKSQEEICLKYLKKRIDNEFDVNYSDRYKIMKKCFSTIEILKFMNKFTIYKYDFKNFFSSVSSRLIFEKYILKSNLKKNEVHILDKFTRKYTKCYAGLPTSNVLIEIIARDFDLKLKLELKKYGLIFYERFVDDGLLMFNKRIDESKIEELITKLINEVFNKEVKINKDKCIYISDDDKSKSEFSYLGYQFEKIYEKDKVNFHYGINENKINKYNNKIKDIVLKYKKDNNIELFRQRIQFLFSRVVFYNYSKYEYKSKWEVVGIINNYGELRKYLNVENKIIPSTVDFLKNALTNIVEKEIENSKIPYFLKGDDSKKNYSLYNYLNKNTSIVFHPNIGWDQEHLKKKIIKINKNTYVNKKSYRELVSIYYDELKLKR